MIISMLTEANLPLSFTGDAFGYAISVLNVTPTSALKGKTPYEAWHGTKPDLS